MFACLLAFKLVLHVCWDRLGCCCCRRQSAWSVPCGVAPCRAVHISIPQHALFLLLPACSAPRPHPHTPAHTPWPFPRALRCSLQQFGGADLTRLPLSVVTLHADVDMVLPLVLPPELRLEELTLTTTRLLCDWAQLCKQVRVRVRQARVVWYSLAASCATNLHLSSLAAAAHLLLSTAANRCPVTCCCQPTHFAASICCQVTRRAYIEASSIDLFVPQPGPDEGPPACLFRHAADGFK